MRMKHYMLWSIACGCLGIAFNACYKATDPLPPCNAAPSACGGYPDEIVVTDTKREAGTR